jgi:hypothetical protein
MNISLYARPVMDHQVENTAPGIALVAHDACKQEMRSGLASIARHCRDICFIQPVLPAV